MIISGTTDSYCIVKDTKISGTTAYIKLLIVSNTPQQDSCAFSFWVYDLDTKLYTRADNNIYWIDRCDNYTNDSRNIDINMYKEILLQIDITDFNRTNMRLNRWVRNIQLIITSYNSTGFNNPLWVSDSLELISKEIVLPEIKDIKLTQQDDNIQISFKKYYETQEDFNYADKNIFFTINIESAYTSKVMETHTMFNYNSDTSEIIQVLDTLYEEPINICIYILNNKEEVLFSKKLFYNPEQHPIRLQVLNKTFNPVRRIAVLSQDGTIKEIIKSN